MANIGSESTPGIIQACQEGADEAAASISRVLEVEAALAVGEAVTGATADWKPDFDSAALAFRFQVESQNLIGILVVEEGAIPDWCENPDETGISKLNTLAQELGVTLLPDDLMPTDFKAGHVASGATAIGNCAFAAEQFRVDLHLNGDGFKGCLALFFPSENADNLFVDESIEPAPAKAESTATDAPITETPVQSAPIEATDFHHLPALSRSLLKIQLPLVVRLASTKLPVGKIVELAAGSIIQFDKSCEETLTLEIGKHDIAEGEVVKVGEKFGIRITSMVLPPERFFATVKQQQAAAG